MVIARPTAIAEMKKKNGSAGVYQNGCSFVWHDQVQRAQRRLVQRRKQNAQDHQRNQSALTHFSGFARLKRSSTAAENSNASTVV